MNEITNVDEKINWSALEYEDKKQSNDWFWALGVIVITGSVTSIIFQNYFFAMILIIGGALMFLFSMKKPDTVFYELNNKGLRIKNRLFPYEKIKTFWVTQSEKPTFFIKSERLFMPILSIPITKDMASEIRNKMLSKSIGEEEIKENPAEKIMEYLGF